LECNQRCIISITKNKTSSFYEFIVSVISTEKANYDRQLNYITKCISNEYKYEDLINKENIDIIYNLFRNDVVHTGLIKDSNILVLHAVYYQMTKQVDKELIYLKSAIKLNNSFGMNNLANYYLADRCTKKNPYEAIKWYKKAIDLGNIYAINNIAACYAYGHGFKRDYDKAISLVKHTKNFESNKVSTKLLGDCYIYKGKHAESLKWYLKAAELGNSIAMYLLGNIYYTGIYITQNYTEATKWYQKSVDNGNINAMNTLGLMYHQGIVIPKNLSKACELYKHASDLGSHDSMNNLGNYYYCFGNGIYNEAMKWYNKGMKLGNIHCIKNVAECYFHGNGCNQDYKQAFELFLKAANLNNAVAQHYVGQCYEKGFGTEINYIEAIKFYKACISNKDSTDICSKAKFLLTCKADLNKLMKNKFIVIVKMFDELDKENEQLMFANDHLKYFPGYDLDQANHDFSLLTSP
jgi:TPR repeat protein